MPLCVGLVTECGRPFALFDDKPMKEILKLGRKSANEENALVSNGENVRDAVFEKQEEVKTLVKKSLLNKIVSLSADMATCQHRSFIGKKDYF